MTRIPLTLGKHYLLIDSPISFYLIDNEENSVYRPSGVWQLNTWNLLPEKYQKDHPVYTLSIEYDESKLADGKELVIRESDIDLGDGVAGVSGQSVMLTGINDSLLPISVSVSNFPDVQKVTVQNQPKEIAVNNLPENQKVNVSNFPNIQKVNVQNNPTSIAVNNFPVNQKVNVSNFPENQKVNVSNFPYIQNVTVPGDVRARIGFSVASHYQFYDDFTKFCNVTRNEIESTKLILIQTSYSAGETLLLVNFNFPVFYGEGVFTFMGYYKNISDSTDYFSERFRLYSLGINKFVNARVYFE